MEFIWGSVRKLFAFINAHSCKLKTLVHNSHFGSWEPLFNHFSLLILVSPSFLFKRFILSKFVNGPDVFYNLVNYCFSLQASWGTEHTWPEGTNFNNCFSKVRWICNAVFHLLKCQIKLYFLKLWQAILFFFFLMGCGGGVICSICSIYMCVCVYIYVYIGFDPEFLKTFLFLELFCWSVFSGWSWLLISTKIYLSENIDFISVIN